VRQKRHVEELEQRLAEAHRRLAELETELAGRAERDALTGLPSEGAFERRLHAEVERSRRHGRPLTIAAVDVDGFHQVNAGHGREVADRLLCTVASILHEATRVNDVVCRTSADEFLVLLPETRAHAGRQAFERILLELEAARVGPIECVAVSVGLAEWVRPMSPEALVLTAVEAMQRARAAGGARIAGAPGPEHQPAAVDEPVSDAVAGLAEALSERDRYTGEHSESVVDLAAQVARGLGLDEREVERVKAAALLHDIGKVAMPDEILHKPGPLDEREWEIMYEHPVIGERILRAIPGLGTVARIVRHEHERWDGGGYPDGLAGEQIPVGARIILACDAYHAMISDRPYRKAITHAEAIRELAANAGSQFDPQVTEQLIGCLYGSRLMGAARTEAEAAAA
jgi:diguanylate cyclase (GGDEF)-like protein/putative nucleotidyltransferase with HDIG domain